MEFDYNDPYVLTQMEAHINYLESEVEILNECLTQADKTICQLEGKITELEGGRKQFERESRKQIRMEVCDHEWGAPNWVDPCFYECRCTKCGKVQTFYERD